MHVFFFPLDMWAADHGKEVVGKNVIVTGSSMGIGKSLAIEFASKGAENVVIVSRSESRLQDVRQEIMSMYPNVQVHVVAMDLSTEASCQFLIDESVRLMGSIDYLVLNHITNSQFGLWFDNADGSYSGKPYLENLFAVNTFSYMWTASAAMKELTKSRGRIAVVSSLAGYAGPPNIAAYASTKHALHGFFNSLRNELQYMKSPVSITVCAIGATDTEGAKEAMAKMTNVAWDSPHDAAVSIIKGASIRKRNVFHPHFKVYPAVWLYSLYPEVLDYILQVMM